MTEEQSIYDERWQLVLRHAEQLDLLKERVQLLEAAQPAETGSGVIDAAIALADAVATVAEGETNRTATDVYRAEGRFRAALAATDRELGREFDTAPPPPPVDCIEGSARLWELATEYADKWENGRPGDYTAVLYRLRAYVREHGNG